MKIFLDKQLVNLSNNMRRIGYHPDRRQKPNSKSFSKRIGGADYPKFHVYYNEGTTYLSLHIDMKQASYGGTAAHSGEYSEDDNQWLKEESLNIKKELTDQNDAQNKTTED
jgi:hypothetical protein